MIEHTPRGLRVTMDPVKFPKLVNLVYLIDSEVIEIQSGENKGRRFCWLVIEGSAHLSPSRRKVRSAWIEDLRVV